MSKIDWPKIKNPPILHLIKPFITNGRNSLIPVEYFILLSQTFNSVTIAKFKRALLTFTHRLFRIMHTTVHVAYMTHMCPVHLKAYDTGKGNLTPYNILYVLAV